MDYTVLERNGLHTLSGFESLDKPTRAAGKDQCDIMALRA